MRIARLEKSVKNCEVVLEIVDYLLILNVGCPSRKEHSSKT